MLRAVVVSQLTQQAAWIEALGRVKRGFEEIVAVTPEPNAVLAAVGEEAARTVVIAEAGEHVLRGLPRCFGAATTWPGMSAEHFVLALCADEAEAARIEGVEAVVYQRHPSQVAGVLDRVCAAPRAQPAGKTTLLGFGSLLSEASARTTFPELTDFRIVNVPGWRRVFAHTAAIFFERGIANPATGEIASLSAEFVGSGGFVAAAFDVEVEPASWNRFREREEEFDLVDVEYVGEDHRGSAVLCSRSSDAAYVAKWGAERYRQRYQKYVETIWDYAPDSNLRPCAVYLRHCVLAVQKAGPRALDSFLDDTYLVDRRTRLRDYLAQNPQVMATSPPPSLVDRYSG